ncbi:nephrin-like isoform X2 [Limulus polyphemus]|uniref:Nephrin-like isoform X2 n=1 Tax=Limulus polyphemus TaxID=6850 RepID=A0ABM1SNF2_LIMPO|nr:nephrin-like isoform X2 [Limulus polyphemus]
MTKWRLHTYLYLLILSPVALSGVPGIKLKPVHYYDEQKEYPEYRSVVGRKLVLPCNITPPSPDDRVSLVLWYRGTSGNPLYGVDARNEPVENAKHVIRDEYSSRTSLNITARSASLVIQPVTEDDAGEYRCRVDYQRGRTSHRKLNVSIIVPPKDIYIRYGDHRYEGGRIGPFDEGSYLNLTCEAVGGNPPPIVSWWSGSILIDDTYWRVSEEAVANSLDIPYLYRNYSMMALTCNASNTNFIPPRSITVKIDLNLKPQIVRISSPRSPLLAGIEMEITCQSQGSLPPAEITWWMEGKKLKASQKPVTGNRKVTTSHIFISPRKEDNGKKLVCRAKNPRLSESALEDIWKLDVQYKPELYLELQTSDEDNVLREGTSVYLDCKINANPQYREVQWILDDHRLFSNPVNGIEIHGHTLMIKNVSREHEGSYRCAADNLIGKGEISPICASRPKTIYGVGKEGKVDILCELIAEPLEVVFRWRFNTSGETVDVNSFSSNRTSSVATFSPKSKYDYGTLYCWGENSIGVQQEPCVFNIIPSARPEPVTNCSVENQTERSFTVNCIAGEDGGLNQRFHLEVYTKNSHRLLVNHTRFDQPIFEVNDLPPDSSLRISIYGSTARGKSPAVLIDTKTLLSTEKQPGIVFPLLISPLVAVLLGIIIVLVILGMIVLIIVKQRRNRLQQGVSLGPGDDQKSNEQIKNIDDQPDPEDKCPDVVPPRNVSSEDMMKNPAINMTDLGTQRIYENLRIDRDRTYENIIAREDFLPNQEELMYRELSPSEPKTQLVRRTDVEHTEYANIDHQRSHNLRPCPRMETGEELDGFSVETPLMNSLKNDRRWGRTDRKRPVVSTAV